MLLSSLAMLSLISGCVTSSDYCSKARYIYLTDGDKALPMSRRMKEGLVYHDETFKADCL